MAKTKVVFICIANTCRSPMAEAIARKVGGDDVEAYSAGLSPTGMVADGSLAALAELGYPADGLRSKGLEDVPLREMDIIVSLIGPDGLRFLPRNLGAELETWFIRDPYGEDEEVYLASARTIERKIKDLFQKYFAGELLLS